MTSSDQPTFWIGRNPAAESRLPYLLRLPVSGEGRIFLGAREPAVPVLRERPRLREHPRDARYRAG